jgi:hypothetical protein
MEQKEGTKWGVLIFVITVVVCASIIAYIAAPVH